MPLYEYVCEDCGYRFEVIQRFSDKPLEVCPKCGGKLRKVFSPPAIHFKGTGWYATDYKKKDNGNKHRIKGKKEDIKGERKKREPEISGSHLTS